MRICGGAWLKRALCGLVLAALLGSTFLLGGCGTIRGLGDDVEWLGRKISGD